MSNVTRYEVSSSYTHTRTQLMEVTSAQEKNLREAAQQVANLTEELFSATVREGQLLRDVCQASSSQKTEFARQWDS